MIGRMYCGRSQGLGGEIYATSSNTAACFKKNADMKVKGANTERTMRAVNVARTTNVTDSARLSVILNVFSRSHSMQSVQKCVM